MHPDYKYMYEVLEDNDIYGFSREVMLQSAAVLEKAYPEDFYKRETYLLY
jgi:hypothetical protein